VPVASSGQVFEAGIRRAFDASRTRRTGQV
jgi:hypothetical protein